MLKRTPSGLVVVPDKFYTFFNPTPRPLPARDAHASTLEIYRLFKKQPKEKRSA